MAFKSKYYIITSIVFLAFAFQDCHSQSKRQIELENKRRELQQEIRQITNMLFEREKRKEIYCELC